jgi:hypothetical protein
MYFQELSGVVRNFQRMSGKFSALPSLGKRERRKPRKYQEEESSSEESSASSAPAKKRRVGVQGNGATAGRPSILANYDSQLLSLAGMRITPEKIARNLRDKYGLSEDVCGRKNVENHLRYIKLHGLGKLPPTNNSIDLHAGKWNFNLIIYLIKISQEFIMVLSRLPHEFLTPPILTTLTFLLRQKRQHHRSFLLKMRF